MGADSSKEGSHERELRERIRREVREQEYRAWVHYSRAQESTQQHANASRSNENETRNTVFTQNQQQLYPNLNQETLQSTTNTQNANYYDHYPNVRTNQINSGASGSKAMPVHISRPTVTTINAAQSAAVAKASLSEVSAAKAPSPMVAAAKAPSPMVAAAKVPSHMFAAPNAPSPNTVMPREVAETCQIGYLRLTPTAPPASDIQKKIMSQKKLVPKKVRNPRSKSASKTGCTPNSITTPRSNVPNRNNEVMVMCCTCNGNFGLEIYQCENGHSSCHRCKGRLCKDCRTTISDKRNFALEDYVAKLKAPCENNKEGCQWKIALSEMESHLKECLFSDMACPTNNVTGTCSWKGKIHQMSSHLQENHPDVAFSDVDNEMLLPSICFDNKIVNFVELGLFRFIVYLQVCLETRSVYMAVQLMGPKKSASNWTYELHVYNKREPKRKFTFNDKCHGIATPVQDIINENSCAVLAIPLAMTYINEGAITYKFYITKSTKFNDNRTDCGGSARRKQPLEN